MNVPYSGLDIVKIWIGIPMVKNAHYVQCATLCSIKEARASRHNHKKRIGKRGSCSYLWSGDYNRSYRDVLGR